MKLIASIIGIIAVAVVVPACKFHHQVEEEKAKENEKVTTTQWKIHDMSRPRPKVVAPLQQNLPVPAPPGAVVLFDGKDLSQWTTEKGGQPGWKVENGYMEIDPAAGAIQSKKALGDVYLHVEWASPLPAKDTGQDRGNSGIFFMTKYELQVLDSYQADTYTDGQAGSLYGQFPPRFNACKPPGEWQAYDIFFRRPRFADDSSLISPASITVLHNGILIQDNEHYKGPTSWLKFLPYIKHADELPVLLQAHGSKVRYRNIWAVQLPELAMPGKGYGDKPVTMTLQPDKYTGIYDRPGQNAPITVTSSNGKLFADFFYRPGALELLQASETEFILKETDARVIFTLDDKGKATSLIFNVGGTDFPATKAVDK